MTVDLARVRRLAAAERGAIIEHRVRRGEDPAVVFADVDEVDDFVVRFLRDDALDEEGIAAEYALARALQHDSARPDAGAHRRDADAVDARIFREIGLRHPSLTRAVWRALGDVVPGE